MLNKLHVFVGLKDDVTELKASKTEMFVVYGMYASLALITLLVVNIG